MIRKVRRLLLSRYLKSSSQIIFTCLLFGIACILLEYRLKFIQFSLVSKELKYDQDTNKFDRSVIRQTSKQESMNIDYATDKKSLVVQNTTDTNYNIENIQSIISESVVSNTSTAITDILVETGSKNTLPPISKSNSTVETEDSVEIIEDGEKEKEEFMTRMDKRMEQRRNHLKKTCQRLGINPKNETFQPWYRIQPEPKSWFYNSLKYQLIFCEIPKSSCSNWKKVLMVLNGLANSTDSIKQGQAHASPIGMVRTSPSIASRKIYEQSLKMMVVREPFERLVSAYQDKVASKAPSYQATFGRFSDEVAKKYGDRWNNPTQEENGITKIVTCEQHEATLECTQPYHVIEILSSTYGRSDWETCTPENVPNSDFKDCWSTHSHYITSQLCNGKSLCRVVANQVQFGAVASCYNIPKYLTITYRCKSISQMKSITVCSNKQEDINCPQGYFISIGSAFFGRAATKTCLNNGAIYNLNCKSETAPAVVSAACHLRQNCSIEASVNWIQSDDCPATSKYLTVWYTCQPTKPNLKQNDLPESQVNATEYRRKIRSLPINNTLENNNDKIPVINNTLPHIANVTGKLPLNLNGFHNTVVESKAPASIPAKTNLYKELPQPKIYVPPKYIPRRYDLQASFDEFLSYIVDPDNAEVTKDSIDHGNPGLKSTSVRHWQHHATLCHPCHIQYDVIAHVETLAEDARYILERIGAPESLKFPGGYDSSGKQATDKEKVIKQFSKISLQKIKQLYEFYQTDFELFNYPVPQLLSTKTSYTK